MISILLPKLTNNIDVGKTGPSIVGYLNFYNYLIFRKRPELITQINSFTLDGIALVWFLGLLSRKKYERQSPDFSSYFVDLFTEIDRNKETLFVLGGSPDDCSDFCGIMKQNYPGLNLVGRADGYRKDEDVIIEEINDLSPSKVIIGMGSPKQESFAADLKAAGYKGVIYCCGALISQTADHGQYYYPKWITDLHLRWLYRIVKEPKVFKRCLIDYPKGIFFVMLDWRKRPQAS